MQTLLENERNNVKIKLEFTQTGVSSQANK